MHRDDKRPGGKPPGHRPKGPSANFRKFQRPAGGGPAAHRPQTAKPRPSKPSPGGGAGGGAWQKTDWSAAPVSEWYDQHVGESGGEYHREVVLPGVLRLLAVQAGDRVIDVACGQGVLCRQLAERGAEVTGVDAAESLVAAARGRGPASIRYEVADARELGNLGHLPAGGFDAAACVLAIQNIHPIGPVFQGAARLLRPGGRFVLVMMHPCFRGPKETRWGWDAEAGVQFRRVDRYLLPRKAPIVTNPGKTPDVYTWSFHKPIEAYVRALRGAGMLVDWLEEWPSHKTSEPGPRAAAENQARKEIPMFLALRALKVAVPGRAGESVTE